MNLPESLAANQAIFHLEKLPPGQPKPVFGNMTEGTMAGNGGPSLGVRALTPILLCTVIPGESRHLLSFSDSVGRGTNEAWKLKGSRMMTKEVIGDCFPGFRDFIINDSENCLPGFII